MSAKPQGGTAAQGPYVGFRRWQMKSWQGATPTTRTRRTLRLFPLNQLSHIPWDTDTTVARCSYAEEGQAAGHSVPHLGHSCGLYHCARPEQIETGAGIAGAAVLFGRVLRATRGYKAEKARIIALVDPKRDSGAMLADDEATESDALLVAREYGVPLLPDLATLLTFAEEHAPLPSEEDVAQVTRLTAEVELELEVPTEERTESGLTVVHGEETWLAKLEAVREFVPEPWRATDGLVEEDDAPEGVAKRWLRLALVAEVKGLRRRAAATAQLDEFAKRFSGEVQNFRPGG